jgi:hypothetical protein
VNSVENSQKLVKGLLAAGAHVDIANQVKGWLSIIWRSIFTSLRLESVHFSLHQEEDIHSLLICYFVLNVNLILPMRSLLIFFFVSPTQLGQRPVDVAGNEATKFTLLKLHNEKDAQVRARHVKDFAHQLLDLIFKTTPQTSSSVSTEIIDYLHQHASNYPELLEYESGEVRSIHDSRLTPCRLGTKGDDLLQQQLLFKIIISSPFFFSLIQLSVLMEFILVVRSRRLSLPLSLSDTPKGRYTPLMLNCMIPLWPTYPQSPDARAAEQTRYSITQALLRHVPSVTHQDTVSPSHSHPLWRVTFVFRVELLLWWKLFRTTIPTTLSPSSNAFHPHLTTRSQFKTRFHPPAALLHLIPLLSCSITSLLSSMQQRRNFIRFYSNCSLWNLKSTTVMRSSPVSLPSPPSLISARMAWQLCSGQSGEEIFNQRQRFLMLVLIQTSEVKSDRSLCVYLSLHHLTTHSVAEQLSCGPLNGIIQISSLSFSPEEQTQTCLFLWSENHQLSPLAHPS